MRVKEGLLTLSCCHSSILTAQSIRQPTRIEVFGSDLPNLDLLDLPGLVGKGNQGETTIIQDTQDLVEETIRKYKDRAIFLAIRPANHDVREDGANNKTLQIIHKMNIKDQTLGVLTKCDNVTEDEKEEMGDYQNMLLDKIDQKDIRLLHDENLRTTILAGGYVATANKLVSENANTNANANASDHIVFDSLTNAVTSRKRATWRSLTYRTLRATRRRGSRTTSRSLSPPGSLPPTSSSRSCRSATSTSSRKIGCLRPSCVSVTSKSLSLWRTRRWACPPLAKDSDSGVRQARLQAVTIQGRLPRMLPKHSWPGSRR